MPERRPLVLVNGRVKELPTGDTLPGSGGSSGPGTVLSPAQITSWQNNYNPTGWGSSVQTIRLNGNSAYPFITGLLATAGGHRVKLLNVGSNPIGLYDNNSSSTDVNRFAFLGQDVTILPGRCVELEYDGTSNRWRLASAYNIWAEPAEWAMYDRVELYHRNATSGGHHLAIPATTGALGENSGGSGTIRPRIGVVTLSSASSSGSRSQLAPPVLSNYTMYTFHDGTSYVNYHVHESAVRFNHLSDATDIFSVKIGWLDSESGSVANSELNGFFLLYRHDLNSGRFVIRSLSAGTATDTNTTFTVATGTWYRTRIIVYPDGSAAIWINGSLIGSVAAGGVPGAGRAFAPFVILRKEAGTNARSIDADYMGLGTIYNSAR